MIETTSPAFFESLYANDPDPWCFATSAYEQSRYSAIIEALSHRRYLRAFEPGCSVGILTAKLAPLCSELVAMDVSPTAVQHAREHCRYLPSVEIRCGSLPVDMPDGNFDLVVFSEIGYYFEESKLISTANLLLSRLEPGGVLLGAHWLGNSADHILSGARVQEILGNLRGLDHTCTVQTNGFRLDRWQRTQ